MKPNQPAPQPSSDLRARVLQSIRAAPAPTRGEVLWRNFVLGLAGTGVMLAVFGWASGLRQEPRATSLVLETSVGAAVLTLLAMGLVLGRGRSALGPPGASRLAAAVGLPLALLLWKVGVSAQFAGMMDRWPDRPGLKCLALGTVMALGPFAALVAMLQRTEPNHPRLLGSALGVLAAGVAWVFTDLWCPVAYVPHLLLGHALPVAILAGLGAAVGRWKLGFGVS
ncbi:hypothetical protein LBMAG42_26840 [Deltaproteobacteria bacterium]|nr:hypothetical protein LBMAG42_26840 [Deltaproteobacteria bacterium]